MSKNNFYDFAKRSIDIIVALAVGLIFLPVFLLTVMAIKLDSPGPIFYRAKRVGKGGKIFDMWKFRSMVYNADTFLLKNPEYMKVFKQKAGWKFNDAGDDPRITRVGRFIRKYSLDELPNLINILFGEMSIVGPRAYRKDKVGDEISEMLKIYPKLKEEMATALSVKPGLSGPWQVAGRNKLSFDKRIELDAQYAIKKSILEDIKIILKTPFAMLNRW